MTETWGSVVSFWEGILPENAGIINSPSPFVSGSRYNQAVSQCIEYAELRLYRDPDLDFLATRVADGSATATCLPGSRILAIPNSMVVVEEVNIITPAGQAPNSAGSARNPLIPCSVSFLNFAWGTQQTQQQPQYFARNDQNNILLGAAPDKAYTAEFYGTIRPAPLSYLNTSTVLTQYFGDLFIAATMIFWAGYQKTFGAMSGDPQQAMTWEENYQNIKKGAAIEEARKKFQGPGWTGYAPTPTATPPRE